MTKIGKGIVLANTVISMGLVAFAIMVSATRLPLQERINDFKTVKADIDTKIDSLTQQNGDLDREITRLEAEVQQVTTAAADNLKQPQQELDNLVMQLEGLQRDNDRWQSDKKQIIEELSELSGDSNNKKQMINAQAEQSQQLASQIATANNELARAQLELQSVQYRKTQLAERVKKLQEAVSATDG